MDGAHFFKPGDKVTVRKDLSNGCRYLMDDGQTINSAVGEMCKFAGKQVTIKYIKYNQYAIHEMGCWWTDEMFEEYVQREQIDYSKVEAASYDDLMRLFMP